MADHGLLELAPAVPGQSQVVPHVGVQGRRRLVARVRQAVGLDRVRLTFDEPTRLLEIGNRVVEPPHADEPVPPVPQQLGRIGVDRQSTGVDPHSVLVPPEVAEPPPVPNDRVLVRGVVEQVLEGRVRQSALLGSSRPIAGTGGRPWRRRTSCEQDREREGGSHAKGFSGR